MSGSGRWRGGLLSLGLVAIVACGDDRGKSETSGELAAEDSDAGPVTVQDRCLLGQGCGSAILPDQTDYVALSEAEGDWVRLLQGEWNLAPRSEGYRCVRKTMAEDVYIGGFKPLPSEGMHHATLHLVTGTSAPDGVVQCGSTVAGSLLLHAAAVGTESTALPEGVAVKVSAGEQLVLNLHLFNAGDQALNGTAGMLIKRVPKEQVTNEAGAVLAGPPALSIAAGQTTIESHCTVPRAATLFALAPHMHQLGRHMTVTLDSETAGPRVLHDAPFDFLHQLFYPTEPVSLAEGDRLIYHVYLCQ